jgi:hypothetical protein
MPLESLPKEETFQIRVSDENYTQEVIDFPLLEVSSTPQTDDRRHLAVVTRASYLENYAVIAPHRGEKVDHLEIIEVVGAREAGEVVKVEPRSVFEELGYLKKCGWINQDPGFAGSDDSLRKMLADLPSDLSTNKRLRHIFKS